MINVIHTMNGNHFFEIRFLAHLAKGNVSFAIT
jgi:hypothetical protein